MNRSDVNSIVILRFFRQLVDNRLSLRHIRWSTDLNDQRLTLPSFAFDLLWRCVRWESRRSSVPWTIVLLQVIRTRERRTLCVDWSRDRMSTKRISPGQTAETLASALLRSFRSWYFQRKFYARNETSRIDSPTCAAAPTDTSAATLAAFWWYPTEHVAVAAAVSEEHISHFVP